MTLSSNDLFHVVLAIAVLLASAHTFGRLFSRFRQPVVIGEIVGGLVLGPTVLGALAPDVQATIFPPLGAVPIVTDALYQLGLLLLMFVAGLQMRIRFSRDERRTVAWIASLGIALPVALAVIAVEIVDTSGWMGSAATRSAFVLVFSIAVAVTSIPVISRIMYDLGILETAFARIVLAVAVIEDVILYVLLAIALGLVRGAASSEVGLPALLELSPNSGLHIAYHTVATVSFLALTLLVGTPIYRRVSRRAIGVVDSEEQLASRLLVMLGMTLFALLLGVVPLYGAFLAGIVVRRATGEAGRVTNGALTSFSFAFFVPMYFALVGLRLDLVHYFQLIPFVLFLAFACVVKAASVYTAARVAGEPHRGSLNFAVALNARGGPGIVLASVAFDARIINERFFTTLVLLAVVTSLIAGSWLARTVRSGLPLCQDEPAAGTLHVPAPRANRRPHGERTTAKTVERSTRRHR
jgi:Kef-type K+ transport system membrane component KefB